MEITNRETNKYALPIYLILANGITWVCWLPGLIIGLREGYMMPNFDTYHILYQTGFETAQHKWLAVAFFLGVYGPLIGGFVATWMDSGRIGLLDWWNQIRKWKIDWRWYVIALSVTFLVVAIPVIVFGLLAGFAFNNLAIWYILLLLVLQLLGSGLGEEPGWRGYLLPRLKTRLDGDKYIWLLGLIWSVWHFPIVIIQTLSILQDVSGLQIVITILMSLAGNVMALIGMTYIYAWLYNKTESVFLCIVFHALSNVFVFWLSSFLVASQSAGLAIALMPWAVVFILQKRLGKENFPG